MTIQSIYSTRSAALADALAAQDWPGFVRAVVSATSGGHTLTVTLSYPD